MQQPLDLRVGLAQRPQVLGDSPLEHRGRLVHAHVHGAGDRRLQVVLFVDAELERPGEDQLALADRIVLIEGVAPQRDAVGEVVAPLEFRRPLTGVQHAGAGRRRVRRPMREVGEERGGGRADLGEHLSVSVGEVAGAGAEQLLDHAADVGGAQVVQQSMEPAFVELRSRRLGHAHHAVGHHDALMEPGRQILAAKVATDGVRGPGAEGAPVCGGRVEQGGERHRQVRVTLRHPVVAQDPFVDVEHGLHVPRRDTSLHPAPLALTPCPAIVTNSRRSCAPLRHSAG